MLAEAGYLLINNFALASSVNPRQICYYGEIGRHKGLKIPRSKVRIGSSPISSTIQDFVKVVIIVYEALETYSIGSPWLVLLAYGVLALVYFICKDLNKVTDILLSVMGIMFAGYGVLVFVCECYLLASGADKSLSFIVTAAILAVVNILFGACVLFDRARNRVSQAE